MADGTYFHPLSHTHAPTLEALLSIIAPGAATSTPYTLPPTPRSTPPILAAIERARTELRARIAADASSTPATATEEADARDVTLAIWNPATDAIRYVEARKRGTSLVAKDPANFGVAVARTNGVNSTYRVTGNDGEAVVGVRYPIYTSIGTAKKPKYIVQDVTYVPYSSALQTPDVVKAGTAWLDANVKTAYDGLRSDGIGSAALKDKLLADAVDSDLVKSILTIEHVSLDALKAAPDQTLDAFLTVLGTNGDDSFDYSRSSAGAFGIAQFIPSTYASLAKRPELKLNPDFDAGLSDPTNAIRAEISYLDELHGWLPSTTVADYDAQRDRIDEYIAAAYNGGPAKVSKAMQIWDDNFDPASRPHILSRSRLKLETMQYVLKLRQVRDLFRQRTSVQQASL